MKGNKKGKRFSRIFKISLIAFSVLATLTVASAFILSKYYENAIKKLFISELNKRLQSEVSVSDIHFTFFRQFPFGTLEFKDFTAKDAIPREPKDTLLFAKSLLLHFNILDLYHKKYVIKRIDLNNARLTLKIYKDLTDNFHFWKSPDGKASENFSFALEKVVFHQLKLDYYNTPAHQYYSLLLKQVKGKGKFAEDITDLKLSGNLYFLQMKSENIVWLRNTNSTADIALAIDQKKGLYTISKGKIQLEDLNFSIGGSIAYSEKTKTMDLHFTTPDASFSDIINSLPANIADQMKKYDLEGKLVLNATITGNFGGANLPFIDTKFSVEDGKVTYKKENISLEGVVLKGSYRNYTQEKNHCHWISLQEVKGKFNQGNFDGKMDINGFKPSIISFSVKADLNIDELLRFLPDEKIRSAVGDFMLRMNYHGTVQSLEDFNVQDFINGQFDCELNLNSFSWELTGQPFVYKDFNGALTFNNNDVQVLKLGGNINNNSFVLQGKFRNLVPFLLSKSEDLQVNANLYSSSVNLKSLLTNNKSKSDTSFNLVFPERWTGNVNINLDKFDIGHFHGEHVRTNLNYSSNKLLVNHLTLNSSGGDFACDGMIDGSSKKQFDIAADIRVNKVNINRLFYEFGNFGQDYLTDENLKGIVSSDIQCSFRMGQKLNIDLASIIASMDTYVEEGELINYNAISGLGKFIRVDDLSRVKFSNLKNNIFIKNKMVIIPSMDVTSDALNFTMSGTHSFNNEINYHFRLLLSDILWKKAKKAKKENEEFGIEQPDDMGKTTLFILLTGTVDNPIFRYDSKSVKGKIISSFLNEKISLKESLKKEFSRSRKEQDSISLMEEHILKQQEDGKFIIDWENNLKDSLATKQSLNRKAKKKNRNPSQPAKFKVEWDGDPQK